ncbi:ATP-dependent RNA helicase [Tanacetum coccineum]
MAVRITSSRKLSIMSRRLRLWQHNIGSVVIKRLLKQNRNRQSRNQGSNATRRHQANLFNEQGNEYDILVASDAVGMGLNLNIRRIVFYSLSKYNGDKIVPVLALQVKQIAGRAGRRGSIYLDGLTTTLHLDDLDYLIECLQKPFDEFTKVGLFPFFEQVELFAGQLADITFSQLLQKFGENCRLACYQL